MVETVAWAIAKFIAMLVASAVLSSIFAPSNNSADPEAATQDDWKMPTLDEGTPQCVFFGDCWSADWFVLGYGNYRYSAIKK